MKRHGLVDVVSPQSLESNSKRVLAARKEIGSCDWKLNLPLACLVLFRSSFALLMLQKACIFLVSIQDDLLICWIRVGGTRAISGYVL